jgi:hypothetical protein
MFKVMIRVTPNLWHEEHFDTEHEARLAANHAFKTGAYQVELWRKSRSGYVLVKKARMTMKEAAQRCGGWMAADAPNFN